MFPAKDTTVVSPRFACTIAGRHTMVVSLSSFLKFRIGKFLFENRLILSFNLVYVQKLCEFSVVWPKIKLPAARYYSCDNKNTLSCIHEMNLEIARTAFRLIHWVTQIPVDLAVFSNKGASVRMNFR